MSTQSVSYVVGNFRVDITVTPIDEMAYPTQAQQEDKLRELLADPRFEWRKLSTLAQAIGESEADARVYLDHIGATESRCGNLFRA